MKKMMIFTLAFLSLALFAFTEKGFAKDYENTAKPESTVPWEYGNEKMLQTKSSNAPVIADISKWQGDIDWSKASKVLDLVIIRTQDGRAKEDHMHRVYEREATKYNVPFGVYSFVRAGTPNEAKLEARAFYNRASKNTQFYVLDVEVNTNKKGYSMRKVVDAYMDEMNRLTNKKIGLYVANHLYSSFNLNTKRFDFVWIPRYGKSAPSHKHDIWQYTSRGSLPGIKGDVDLNRLSNGAKLEYFTNRVSSISDSTLAKKYYMTNPTYVVTKTAVVSYKKKDFITKNKRNTIAQGTFLKVKKITKSSKGIPHLELTDGTFITASKGSVVKTTASKYKQYYSAKDKVTSIVVIKDVKHYKKSNGNELQTRNKIKANTVLKVKNVVHDGSGATRFQLTNGGYITANKSDVVRTLKTINKYYTSIPKDLHIINDTKVYSFNYFKYASKSMELLADTKLEIVKLEYNKIGYPRFKLSNGYYISTMKSNLKVIKPIVEEPVVEEQKGEIETPSDIVSMDK